MKEDLKLEVEAIIDKKLEPVKSRLLKLIQAHDTVTAEQKEAILLSQRNTAMLMVRFMQLVASRRTDFSEIEREMGVEAGADVEQIKNSETPLDVSNEFWNKWMHKKTP
jgi:hypothetical protein